MLWTVHWVFIPIVDLAETPRISVSLQAGFLSWEWRHLGVDRRQGGRMWFARRAHKGQGLQPDPGTEEGLSDSHHVQMWPARTHSKGTMTQIALARPEFCEIHSTSRYYKVKIMKFWSLTHEINVSLIQFTVTITMATHKRVWLSYLVKKKKIQSQAQTISLFSWIGFLSFPLPKFNWHKENSRAPRLEKGPAFSMLPGCWIDSRDKLQHPTGSSPVWWGDNRCQIWYLRSLYSLYINAPSEVRNLVHGVPAQRFSGQESFS